MPTDHMPADAGTLVARMLVTLFALYVAARLAGAAARRLRQPAVVGEILIGVLIGPHALGLVRYRGLESFFELFAELGVVFLLFVVGLESDPAGIWRVGRAAAAVASFGVVIPFTLGGVVAEVLGLTHPQALFIGAALTATSVGITARVFDDLGQLGSRVASVVLGAAVLDDILGLSLLSIVQGVTGGRVSPVEILLLIVEAIAFVAVALLLGRPAVHRITPRLAGGDSGVARSPIFAFAIILCLGFSALAAGIGLAAIVGAFFAGILFAGTEQAQPLRDAMQPIYQLLVPVFFIVMGLQVNLSPLTGWVAWGGALLIIVVAIAGKLIACGLSAMSLGRREALVVGIGMVPRGEVGIVVALAAIATDYLYSVIILMSIVTSIVAPPFLRLALARARDGRPEKAQ
jgi:Kef-type K+ transport system membrane component KefB